jgi:tetratricopeptide (TPR) repeat protein
MGVPPPTSDCSATNLQRDLFLSYNGRDRDTVARVRKVLSLRKISTFYDRTDLTPGQPWFDELEAALRRVRGVAVFIGKDGLGTVQKREMQFALARQATEEKGQRRFPVIPVLLEGADPDIISGFLVLNTWVDLRRGLENAQALDPFARAVEQPTPPQTKEAASRICPYRGLNPFREEDSALFFGREAFSQKVFDQVLRRKLVVLIGRSGSGKSSVAQAGLLPLLRRQKPPAETWESLIFSPGNRPFHRMAAQLVPLWSPPGRELTDIGTESEKLGNRLASGEVSLAGFIDLALQNLPDTSRLLAIVDQFEELFTLRLQDEQRQNFIKQLLAASVESRLTVLLTLRADFYGQAIKLRELSDAIEAGLVNVGEMSREELRRAIEEPATRTGLQFETGLVERILDHVQQQPGSLPLLEYALTELWERREDDRLTHAAYDAIGGVEGAINKRAEAQFEKLTPTQKQIALPALSRLVRVSSASEEGTDTRQVVKLSDLNADAQAVMRIFAEREARLVVAGRDETSGEETVEVAHEALIRNWAELRRWIDKDREFLLWRQRLDLFLSEWQRSGENAGAQLTGIYLEEGKRWLRQRGEDLNDEQRRFIGASARTLAVSTRWRHVLLVAASILVLSALAWWGWTRSDTYQIRMLFSESNGLLHSAWRDSVHQWAQSLVYAGKVPEALACVRQLPDQFEARIEGLAKVSTALENAGSKQAADQTVNETLSAIRALKGDPESALAVLARELAAVHKWDQALEVAGQGKNTYSRSETLEKLLDGLLEVGKLDEALSVLPRIDRDFNRDEALDRVVDALVAKGRTDEALSVVAKFETTPNAYGAAEAKIHALAAAGKQDEALSLISSTKFYIRARGLIWVAESLVKAGRSDEALTLLGRLNSLPHDPIDDYSPRELAELASVLLGAGKPNEANQIAADALRILSRNEGDWYNVKVLVEIQPVLDEAGAKEPAAQALASALQSVLHRGYPCRAVENLSEAGREEQALRFALRVQDPAKRVECLSIASAGLANARRLADARKGANEALQAADKIQDDRARSSAFEQVAAALAVSHEYRQARLAAERCTSSSDKLSAYSAILLQYAVECNPELRKKLSPDELSSHLHAR